MLQKLRSKIAKIPITIKITMWYTVFIVLLLAIIIFGSFFAINEVTDRVSKRDLVENVTKISNGRERFQTFDDGIYYALYNKNDEIISGAVPNKFNVKGISENIVSEYSVDEEKYYYYDIKIKNSTSDAQYIRGVVSVSSVKKELQLLPIIFLIISPFLIIIIIYGGYRIVKKSFKPINVMTATANSIKNSGNFSERIQLSNGKDEVHQLGIVFNEMLETLEASYNREKEFSSDVSHELRTPVSVILAESEYALKYSDNLEEAKNSFSVIERQSKRMSAMINQILELTRLDKVDKIETEKINFSEMLEKTLSDYNKLALQNNITLKMEIVDNIEIFADKILLGRVIDNLLLNAIKFTKSEILVLLKLENNKIIFSVEDNGLGIEDSEKQNIWKRFYKIDKSRTNTDNKSSGLGLSLVKKIVELHNAKINIENSKLGGAKFIIRF